MPAATDCKGTRLVGRAMAGAFFDGTARDMWGRSQGAPVVSVSQVATLPISHMNLPTPGRWALEQAQPRWVCKCPPAHAGG